jgi:hypothetical protein
MQNNNIITIVAHPTPGRAKDSATQEEYLLAKFLYNTTTPMNVHKAKR